MAHTLSYPIQLVRKDLSVESAFCFDLQFSAVCKDNLLSLPALSIGNLMKFLNLMRWPNGIGMQSLIPKALIKLWKDNNSVFMKLRIRRTTKQLKKIRLNFYRLYFLFKGKRTRALSSQICCIFELNLETKFWKIILNQRREMLYTFLIKTQNELIKICADVLKDKKKKSKTLKTRLFFRYWLMRL